jgi:hypothetical protein
MWVGEDFGGIRQSGLRSPGKRIFLFHANPGHVHPEQRRFRSIIRVAAVYTHIYK